MNKDLSRLWNIVLGEIETEVSQANFLTLFKNTALVSLEQNTATIAVPSPMIIDLLKKRFFPLIKNVLEKHTATTIHIAFVPKTFLTPQPILKSEEKNAPLFFSQETNKTIGHLPRVRADFTFDNLAVSSSNQLAFVSAQTVADNPGRSYNPFFIYGPVGVGKTHLLQAIANKIYLKKPEKKIVYITSEEFTNEVVEAIRNNQTAGMKRRFRSAYVLLIDDVQFIEGKERVQEELFHTFNILVDNGSQICLSSDRPPNEIKKIEKRLSSRFAGGLTVDIQPPDFELKTAILLIKAKKYGVELLIDVAKIIAEKAEDTRSLEGLLLRVITESTTKGEELTGDFAQKSLNNVGEEKTNHIHSDHIIESVCGFYGVKTTQIKGPKRNARLVRARQVAMFLLKNELSLTYVEIGNILGGRDHTTVIYGVEKMSLLSSENHIISRDILGITKLLHG